MDYVVEFIDFIIETPSRPNLSHLGNAIFLVLTLVVVPILWLSFVGRRAVFPAFSHVPRTDFDVERHASDGADVVTLEAESAAGREYASVAGLPLGPSSEATRYSYRQPP